MEINEEKISNRIGALGKKYLPILFTCAIFLKFLSHQYYIPGSGFFLVITSLPMSFFYLICGYFLFIPKVKKEIDEYGFVHNKRSNPFPPIFMGFSLSMFIIGATYVMMRWPGGRFFLDFSSILMAISAIITFSQFIKNKSSKYKSNLLLILFFVVLMCALYAYLYSPLWHVKDMGYPQYS